MNNDKYEKILYNFIMRICELSSTIGNNMLEEYLSLHNPYLNSKISAEIVLLNDAEVHARVRKFFAFINTSQNASNY